MLKPCRDQEGLIKISYEIKIFICVLKAKFFVLADILSLGSDSVNPHIFLPPDQNVADQMDPDPGPQLLSTGFNYVFIVREGDMRRFLKNLVLLVEAEKAGTLDSKSSFIQGVRSNQTLIAEKLVQSGLADSSLHLLRQPPSSLFFQQRLARK